MPDTVLDVDRLTIAGTGRLRAGVERRLARDGLVPAVPIVLGVGDGWDPELLAGAAATAAAAGVAFLGVHIELGQALIGPLVRPGVPGCERCLAMRRAAVDRDGAADRAALLEGHGRRLAGPSSYLTSFAVTTIAGLIASELATLTTVDDRLARPGRRTPRTQGAVMVVELDRLLTEVHPFLPDPHCPRCGGPMAAEPGVTRDAAMVRLYARPTSDPGSLRSGDVGGREREAALRHTYVDSFAGVVSEVREVDAAGLPVSYARTGLPHIDRPEVGIGRAVDRVTSRLAAILEAVERRGGTWPSGPRAIERACFTDVAAHALDPGGLGLPAPGDLSAFAPFDADRELDWVWGYSFRRAEPILVPRSYAYFGPSTAGPGSQGVAADRPFVLETSNGCALGSCYEEAAVHGLLEVVERDAFLLTWYARMPLARVALGSARDVRLRLLAERIECTHGYRIHVFDSTVEHGIPSVLLLAVDLTPDPQRPAVMCAAAAHIEPERACWAALGELALVVSRQVQLYPQKRQRAAAMVTDPDLVQVMDDHMLLYSHGDTVARWDFLLDPDYRRRDGHAGDGADLVDGEHVAGDGRDFADAFAGRPRPAMDVRDDLLTLVSHLRRVDLDVVVVDQTGPEQQAAGLSTVKVIVPGTLPMTFGHRNRRVDGLPRLRAVPTLLGYRDRPLRDEDINPHPHPFS